MPKRMIWIVMLLIALALACTRRAPVQIDLPRLVPATSTPAAPAEAATPTGGEVFLPEVSTGADQTQAAAEAPSTQPPAAVTAAPQATAAPDTTEAAAVQTTAEAVPLPTEAPQVAATQPAANTLYLPVVGSGREGEAGGGSSGGSPSGESPSGHSPSIALEANPVVLRAGETLTVVGRPVGIGLPYYDLTVQDQGAQLAQVLGQVTYENEPRPQPGVSQVLELVSAEGSMDQATFILRAKAPGTAAVQITATGEVQTESGAFMWSGGSSQAIAVTVTSE